nr:hypothetical protein [Tanacetum cinerariifolium]
MFIKYSTGQIRPKKSRGKEPARKKTSSKRRVKKKVTLSADENIISDDPDVALELVKSINHTEAEEAEAARHIHATHARIVTESAKKNSDGRRVFDEEKDITEENVILEWGDEQDSKYSDDDNDDVKKDGKDGDVDDEGDDYITDTQDADDEDVKTESDEDDIYRYKIRMRKDEDEEMINAEVDDSDKANEEITNATKADAEKTSEVKDDPKKTELPPSSSSLSVSLESPLIAIVTTLPPLHVSTTPPVPQQTTILIPTQPIITNAPTITNAVLESNALTAIELRVAKLEKDVSELKTVNHSTEALAILKSQVPSIIDNYLGSKVGDVFQKELKKHTTDLLQKYSLQQFSESSEKQTSTFDLEQGSKKSSSKILQIKREQAKKQ